MITNLKTVFAKTLMLALLVSACLSLLVSGPSGFRAQAQRSNAPDLAEFDAGKSEMRPVI